MKRTSWAILIILGLYGFLGALPTTLFWFDADYTDIEYPNITFNGHVSREMLISYSVIVRDTDGEVFCDDSSNPFLYSPNAAAGAPKTRTIGWWAPGDPRCAALSPGTYQMTTCWKVLRPFGSLPFPPKFHCVKSNVFTVAEQ